METGGSTGKWVVVGQSGPLGMITSNRLSQAVGEGRGTEKLVELLRGPIENETASGSYPYVHADQPLDTAMRRMAEGGVDILPVVSRNDLTEIVGLISVQDVLAAYGFGTRRSRVEEPPVNFRAPVAKLIVLAAVIAGMLVLAVSLGYVYRSRRAGRARQYFRTANELVENGRYSEAVEQYRRVIHRHPKRRC